MGELTDEKVKELLERFRIHNPPVPVDKIAKKLGFELVALSTSDDDISGAIIRKGGEVIIAVNPSHHLNRRRFTIAHELGHYFLHEGLDEHVDQDFRVAWRSADSSKAVNWLEIEANRFAAELLMPTQFLRRDLDSLHSIGKRTVALLASAYKVSPEAMKFRLTNLGITGPF